MYAVLRVTYYRAAQNYQNRLLLFSCINILSCVVFALLIAGVGIIRIQNIVYLFLIPRLISCNNE